MSPDRHARTMLPIPDRPSPGLTTYDAKDPDTSYPPIEPCSARWARRMF
jgi:arylsulfatase